MLKFLRLHLLAGLLLLLSSDILAQTEPAACNPEGPALEQARALLKSMPLIDGHNDLPWVIREESGGDVLAYDLAAEKQLDTDIPKLRAGLLGAQFWSVWVPGEIAPIDYGRVQMEQIDIDCFVSPVTTFGNAEPGGYVPAEQFLRTRTFMVESPPSP